MKQKYILFNEIFFDFYYQHDFSKEMFTLIRAEEIFRDKMR